MVYFDVSYNPSTTDICNLRVLFWKHVTAEERRALPDYQCDGEPCSLLRIPSLIVEQPCDIDAKRWKDPTSSQPNTCVPRTRAMDILDPSEKAVANCGHGSKASYDKP